jgi:glutaredoxin
VIALSTLLLAACQRAEVDERIQPDALPQKPAGSGIESLGESTDTRIYYQFIDERSQVIFVERLEDVPAEWRDRVGYVEMSSPPPLAPGDLRKARAKKYASKTSSSKRGGHPNVILYYAEWCQYCHRAKRHLERRGIPFELRDVDVPAAKAEMIAKTGQSGIPVIEVDGRIMKGYSEKRLDHMLSTSG